MLEVSIHTDPLSAEATAMLVLSKKIPLSYQAQNGDHIILDGLDDFGFTLDYFVDDNNAHSSVRNYGK